jgi:hypothetical protein
MATISSGTMSAGPWAGSAAGVDGSAIEFLIGFADTDPGETSSAGAETGKLVEVR